MEIQTYFLRLEDQIKEKKKSSNSIGKQKNSISTESLKKKIHSAIELH